jgi:hypothetical protein
MRPREPNREEPAKIEDNAVHIPDPESDKTGGTQIAVVAVAIVVILSFMA